MSRKSNVVALAAVVASFGAIAVATTDASANGIHINAGTQSRVVRTVAPSPIHFNVATQARVVFRPSHPIFHPNFPHWPHYNFGWRRPYLGGPMIATAGGYAAAPAPAAMSSPAPAANQCNCLTKEYAQDGAVIFKDLCTQEVAVIQPAQQGDAQPQ
jgi:hypothetical protein